MKSKKKSNILELVFAYSSLLIMAVCVYTVMYWKFHDYRILEPLEGNYQLDQTVYKQGDNFDIRLRVCKTREIPENIYGRFVDGLIYSVPENTSNFEEGCYDTIISSVDIPENLPVGMYHYEESIEYRVNPIRTIIYEFTTEEFEVIGNGCN